MDEIKRLSDGDQNSSDAEVAEARATVLSRRVAALEAVVAIERRLREVQHAALNAAEARLARRDEQADITVPRPHAHAQAAQDDDATIPAMAPHLVYDPSQTVRMPAPQAPTPSISISHSRRNLSQPIRTWSRPAGAGEPAPRERTLAPGEAVPIALAPGFELLEYRIDKVLGQGGFGITYLGTDVNLNVKVAIKEYLPGGWAQRSSDKSVAPRWAEDNDFYLSGLESFLIEARTLATFRHPSIVRVARFFEANSTAYMVLEYERGKSLKQWQEKNRNIGEQRLLSLLKPLLEGLALVHDTGYLHRDIKPDNIYVRKEDGSLVLLDFGAARVIAGGANGSADVLTPGYAPPEQYSDGKQGPWTDIYALGATLYWLVTGEKPAPAPERVTGERTMTPAVQAGQGRYSEQFLAALDWALTPDPAGRPQTVTEFAQALFAAHTGSMGLQQALELDARKHGYRWRRLFHPPSWPMVSKLSVALVLAALLPMTITAYYNLNGSVDAVSASELDNLQSLARSMAGRVTQLIADHRELAQYLAADDDLAEYLQTPSEQKQAALERQLKSLVNIHPDVLQVDLLDMQGATLVSTAPPQAGAGAAANAQEYFRAAAAGTSYMSSIVPGPQPAVIYANPVYNAQRKAIGVAVLRMRVASIVAALSDTNSVKTRLPFMVDGDGVLLHTPVPRHMPNLLKAIKGVTAPGHARYHSTYSGVDEYAGYAPVQGQKWVVGVSEARTEFEAPLRHLFNNVLISVAIVGLVFLALAVLAARSVVKPVERLSAAANALKAGDYDGANVAVTSDDELGRLARTFNVMIDVLRQRERETKHGRR